jgi:DNA/RNA endonuclease YhcR with UshA esterase domain
MRATRGFTYMLAALALSVTALAGCGGAALTTTPTVASPTSLPPSITEGSVISWSEAASRIGQTVTVEGPVISADYIDTTGSSLLLNVGLAAPDSSRFLIVMPAAVRREFAQSPDVLYVGRLVRVIGKIEQYRGLAAITIRSPKAISTAQ